MREIITVENVQTDEWFFHNHHDDCNLGGDYVPCSRRFPFNVGVREGIEDGVVDTIEKIRVLQSFREEHKEVINPLFEKFCLKVIENRNGGYCDGLCSCCPLTLIKFVLQYKGETFCERDVAFNLAKKYINFYGEE